MDYPDFLILRLRGPEDSFICGTWMKLFPKRLRGRIRSQWLMWRLPLFEETKECLGEEGLEVTLPFTEEDLGMYTKDRITDMLHRIIVEKGVQNMVVEPLLEQFLEPGLRIDGGMIPYLMLEDIIKYVCRKHQLARRELKPVVMAGAPTETFYVLRKLGTDLNRLTIVCEDPECYEEFAREAYQEQGLLVRVLERPLEGDVYGNLILELSPRFRKDCRFYPEGSVVINLSENIYQIKDAVTVGKRLICYNRFDISARGKVQDNRILQAVIYKTNTQIGMGQLEKGEKIKENYGFRVEKAGIKY